MDSTRRSASWASSPAVRATMQGNRNRDTRPERVVRSEIHRRGLRYRVSARPLSALRLTADVVFPRLRIAVFIDGCFWHGCPDHYVPPASNAAYWKAKLETNRQRDSTFDAALLKAGWLVLRFWEHENTTSVADCIEATVTTRRELFSGNTDC